MVKNSNKKINLILVDDNLIFRTTLRKFLQSEFQYNVIGEVSSGKEFFALSNIGSADVILMDLQMPEMDGYAITRRARINYSQIPVIAITMHAEKAYLEELISAGFKGCVFKPDIYMNLNKAIEAVLNDKYYFPPEIKV
jgi:two-component system, NarL family, response regulator NreC